MNECVGDSDGEIVNVCVRVADYKDFFLVSALIQVCGVEEREGRGF